MTDQYAWWRAALANPDKIGSDELPVHENEPQPGRYRARFSKDKPFKPVAIWRDGNGIFALYGGEAIEADDIWTRACRNPISQALYNSVSDGGEWPDEPPQAGHNLPDDPFEALTLELEGQREDLEKFLKTAIADDDAADKAAVWSKKLADIAKKATDNHKIEKQPHLDAGRAVDDKWRDLREGAKSDSTRLKRHLDTWLTAKAIAERAAAEKVRKEAEALAAQGKEDEAAAKAKEAETPNTSAGRTGAKVALRTFISAEITDYDKLLMALKDRDEIRELVQSLANRAAKSGVDLPGMKKKEERRAA